MLTSAAVREGVCELWEPGKEIWRHRTVENILSNEKYKGDARLQKCYTVDFLSKKRKANEGEVPQYYVEGSHDAIIEPAEWQLVQTEIQRRKNTGRKSARRFKAGNGRGVGFVPDASGRFFCVWKSVRN